MANARFSGPMRRWVVKIGSAMVTNDGRGLDRAAIDRWAHEIARLQESGAEVVLVSSGAVAEGMVRLGWRERPSALPKLQAAAAVGQMGLVQAYADVLLQHQIRSAQILLTHEDLSDRSRYLNARDTLRTIAELGVIAVVNENDTVATDEIRFGDNDTLAALVANLVEADGLIILTDQTGLYDADPRKYPDAKQLDEVTAGDPSLEALASPEGGRLGRGGMYTKVLAAKRAARSGTATVVASGREPNVLTRITQGEVVGTLFRPSETRLVARKQWLASQLRVEGRLVVDEGAARALLQGGRSLLPIGIIDVEGQFARGELVSVLDPKGQEIARGLSNYRAIDVVRIAGQSSQTILNTLGYYESDAVVHCDNMVFVGH